MPCSCTPASTLSPTAYYYKLDQPFCKFAIQLRNGVGNDKMPTMQVACTDFYDKVHLVDPRDLVDRLSVYGVYIAENKVLLIQDLRSLRWELPGGGVEKDETVRQALIREFAEETGVEPKGRLTLVTEWVEHYFDVPTRQAWLSKRKFFYVKKIAQEANILKLGNRDDSSSAKFVSIDKLAVLHISSPIKKVISMVYGRSILK